eukprot:7816117-Prorocentrum_lima.AAC.1
MWDHWQRGSGQQRASWMEAMAQRRSLIAAARVGRKWWLCKWWLCNHSSGVGKWEGRRGWGEAVAVYHLAACM